MQIFFSVFWWIYFFIFFTGYPLLYAAVYFMGKTKNLHHFITERIHPLLPLGYAFVSTIFWILMICTGRMSFVSERIAFFAPSVLIIIPDTMQAMVLETQKPPLVLKTLQVPVPSSQQVLVKIIACGVIQRI